MDKWLSTEQAASYLGLSKTSLYALAQEGKIPVSNVGKKLVFEIDQLDNWIRANKSIDTFFTSLTFDIENNPALREPQRDAYLRAYEYFNAGGKKALIQMPVGCGKSGLAAILPFGIAKGRVLIITPNLTIKDGLFETLDITNRQRCFWRKMRVLEEKEMLAGPYVCNLDEGNVSICQKSHIVVTNIHQLATRTEKWLSQFDDKFFDMIIVDEGHHSAATSWQKVFEKFNEAKIIHLTATPFRSDRQELDGELIFRYSFRSACIKGYIKRLKASSVAPTELTFTIKDETKTYSLSEILKMKEEEWFSRGVALSEPCNISIVNNSLEKLEQARQTGTRHQLIAVACSIHHAKQVRSLYAERGFNAEVIHSKLQDDEKERIIRDLKNGTLDCIVQVQMLGEGFDHPKLTVAAIFNPFRSLAPYIQFVGRIMRVVVQNQPNHPDNYGHIVTHVGLNLDQQLKKFKDFENDDKSFWEDVTGGKEPEPPQRVLDGEAQRRLLNHMVVSNEIVDTLFEEDFVSFEEKEIIAELEEKLRALGLDPRLAHTLYKQNQAGIEKKDSAQPFMVLPQRQWAEARKRLDEEVKRTAKVILNNSKLKMEGMEIPHKLKMGVSGRSNYVCAVQLANQKVNELIGKEKPREGWSLEDFQKAMKALPDILTKIVQDLERAKAVENE